MKNALSGKLLSSPALQIPTYRDESVGRGAKSVIRSTFVVALSGRAEHEGVRSAHPVSVSLPRPPSMKFIPALPTIVWLSSLPVRLMAAVPAELVVCSVWIDWPAADYVSSTLVENRVVARPTASWTVSAALSKN